jgi:hypothetical protein
MLKTKIIPDISDNMKLLAPVMKMNCPQKSYQVLYLVSFSVSRLSVLVAALVAFKEMVEFKLPW